MKCQPFYVCLDESVFISLFYLFVGSIFARGENKLNQIDNLHNGFLLFFFFFFFYVHGQPYMYWIHSSWIQLNIVIYNT